MLLSIAIGTLMTVITVGIHAVGTAWWISKLSQFPVVTVPVTMRRSLELLCSTAVVLYFLHIVEVGVWAIAYLTLPQIKPLDGLEEAIYFSTVTFATLGYGDIVIEGPWRLLSAIQAMSGLFVFGWSTALLFAVVQRIWDAPRRANG